MKNKHHSKKLHVVTLLAGILIGVGLTMIADSYKAQHTSDVAMTSMNGMNHEDVAITSEKQYLEEMMIHHKSAVVMSQDVLRIATDARIKKLASDIIVAQTKEIVEMKSWLRQMNQ